MMSCQGFPLDDCESHVIHQETAMGSICDRHENLNRSEGVFWCKSKDKKETHYLETTAGEAANKDDLLGCLADVNEAATAWSARWEVRDIHIAFLVHLHVHTDRNAERS